MNKTPRIYAMIVAAGQGSRFGASLPKQYVVLHHQTLLQHSVARLAQSAYIDACLLVLAADDSTAQTLDFALPIYHTIGGAERWQSVFAGVEAIIQAGADDTDLILIHDAARPLSARFQLALVLNQQPPLRPIQSTPSITLTPR